MGMVPRDSADAIQEVLSISRSPDGFFMEAHSKLRPVDTAITFLAGSCQGPKIPSSVAQGSAAAARAATALATGEVAVEPIVSEVDRETCGGCGVCVELCPYGAIELVERDGKLVAEVTAALCEGCGTCAAACPSGAMEQNHFKTEQLHKQIEGAFRDPSS